MANLTFTIPDAQIDRIAVAYGWRPGAETKAQFARSAIYQGHQVAGRYIRNLSFAERDLRTACTGCDVMSNRTRRNLERRRSL